MRRKDDPVPKGSYSLTFDSTACLVKATLTLNTDTEELDGSWLPQVDVIQENIIVGTYDLEQDGEPVEGPGTLTYNYQYDIKSDGIGLKGDYSFRAVGQWITRQSAQTEVYSVDCLASKR